MTKTLSKFSMERTCLRNTFLKNRWKVKVKNEEIISDDMEVANILNSYFSNVVKKFKIPEKFVTDSLPQSLSRNPTLNSILKHESDPSMHVTKRFLNVSQIFIFYMLTNILLLKRSKN